MDDKLAFGPFIDGCFVQNNTQGCTFFGNLQRGQRFIGDVFFAFHRIDFNFCLHLLCHRTTSLKNRNRLQSVVKVCRKTEGQVIEPHCMTSAC